MFKRLAARSEGAFVPFTVLGNPDLATCITVVRTLVRSGADALELGFPFSDPVADGPVIQTANRRALEAAVTIDHCWSIVSAARDEFPDLPIGLLVYANLVFHRGPDRFYARASGAGVDSVLVADAPLLEAATLERCAADHGVAPVFIASPNVPDSRLREIAARSRGYVYVTSRSGVTGVERVGLRDDASGVLHRLSRIDPVAASAPPLLGFGIGRPEHVRRALALGAAGVISGSAVAACIEIRLTADRVDCAPRSGPSREMLAALASFVRSMKQATRRA